MKQNVPVIQSTLWIVLMINMIFIDIYSIIVILSGGGNMDIPGDAGVFMAIAVFMTNVPTVMIFLSRVLPFRPSKIMHYITIVFTGLYIIGLGDSSPHYIAGAAVELITLVILFIITLKWKESNRN
ncbi:DUF6326 family protein [Spirochaeta isovalerica]|uniref:Uncharacterized protein n=1 Tax=Spirochaeta isovalerica TaxID=150 RepID=A0A841RBT1_9SPIO|nr:DUF6326 family protein [Spirochaeta isovalerica]MBB6479862.1 hypothetical protein [Spirochaeta isovalerica]